MRSIETKRVAPRVDCITTSVAIAAQYASGNPNRRATASDTVAAMAVRIECITEGRFCGFHFQSFTGTILHRRFGGRNINRLVKQGSYTNLRESAGFVDEFHGCESAK